MFSISYDIAFKCTVSVMQCLLQWNDVLSEFTQHSVLHSTADTLSQRQWVPCLRLAHNVLVMLWATSIYLLRQLLPPMLEFCANSDTFYLYYSSCFAIYLKLSDKWARLTSEIQTTLLIIFKNFILFDYWLNQFYC